MPSRGREWCCKTYRAIKILVTIAAVMQCNCNFHNFTLHVKLISVLIPATPSITTMIIIVHGGHVQSTPSVKRAALGPLLFASCDPHHQPTSPEASNDWLRLTGWPRPMTMASHEKLMVTSKAFSSESELGNSGHEAIVCGRLEKTERSCASDRHRGAETMYEHRL